MSVSVYLSNSGNTSFGGERQMIDRKKRKKLQELRKEFSTPIEFVVCVSD